MKRILGFSLLLIFATSLNAENYIKLNGTKKVPLLIHPSLKHSQQNKSNIQYISLLDIQLSDAAWKTLKHKKSKLLTQNPQPKPRENIQLGMNNVPVLNQGPYGSCVTFANSGAIDAALDKGDYISQLCQLQLGVYLQNTGYNPSGWNGSLGPIVLHQMETFGIVSIEQQQTLGCSGLTKYPGNGLIPNIPMNPEDYHAISTSLAEINISWSVILDTYQRFVDQADMDQTLSTVKRALLTGDRLSFGALLFAPRSGVVGAVGKYHVNNDTWVLTPEILKEIDNDGEYGGHEMIITGFDNNAIAFDEHGQSHKGLLTLRNSWGSLAGDQGDFYMSYDYFKMLTIEVQQIRKVS